MKRHLFFRAAVMTVLSAAVLSISVTSNSRAETLPVKPPALLLQQVPSPFSNGGQAKNAYTGQADDWAVGLITGPGEALVYLCDGRNPGQWFGATVRAGVLEGNSSERLKSDGAIRQRVLEWQSYGQRTAREIHRRGGNSPKWPRNLAS